ncbi:MAG TPA: hypothetical protein DD670_01805 [Planctomycetaceae bacterium]|nr:hypothetical protein [Planctomycetaceae bacterium]
MSGTLQKIAPLLVVAAVFTWCCWPYVFGNDSVDHGGTGGELVAIAKSLLSPTPNSAHKRNPFVTADQLAEELLKTTQAGVENAAGLAAQDKSAEGTVAPLMLRATLVQGERRLATIGNQVYRPGDRLDSGAPPDKAWIVADILAESVVLRRGKETWTLTFSGSGDTEKSGGDDTTTNGEDPAETLAGTGSEPARATETLPAGLTSAKDLIRLFQQAQATGESP